MQRTKIVFDYADSDDEGTARDEVAAPGYDLTMAATDLEEPPSPGAVSAGSGEFIEDVAPLPLAPVSPGLHSREVAVPDELLLRPAPPRKRARSPPRPVLQFRPAEAVEEREEAAAEASDGEPDAEPEPIDESLVKRVGPYALTLNERHYVEDYATGLTRRVVRPAFEAADGPEAVMEEEEEEESDCDSDGSAAALLDDMMLVASVERILECCRAHVASEAGAAAAALEAPKAEAPAASAMALPLPPAEPVVKRWDAMAAFIPAAEEQLRLLEAEETTAAEVGAFLQRSIGSVQRQMQRLQRPPSTPIFIDGVKMDM